MTDPAAARSRPAPPEKLVMVCPFDHEPCEVAHELEAEDEIRKRHPEFRSEIAKLRDELAALAAARLAVQQRVETLESMLELKKTSCANLLDVQQRIARVIGDDPPAPHADYTLPSLVAFVVEENKRAAADAAGTLLRQELEDLPQWPKCPGCGLDHQQLRMDGIDRQCTWCGWRGKEPDLERWIKARDLADRLARRAPQREENAENEKDK